MDTILLIIAGFFSGLFGGLMGIGGSVILLPALAILFSSRHAPDQQHVYQAAAMIMNFFVALPSAIAHHRKKNLTWPILKWLIPAGIVGIFFGVTFSNLSFFQGEGALYLRKMLGLFLFYVLGFNLYRLFAKSRYAELSESSIKAINPVRVTAGVGLPMGFLAGLLGVGGGILCVPLQQMLLRIPLPKAIANSSAAILVITLFGAIYKNVTLPENIGGMTQSLRLAILIIPPSFIGGYLGARLVYILPRVILRIIFILLMLYGGLRLILG
ncbi:MAG: sulfite exporter TauE/SafE family protein [Phycisphaerae bacterium]|jgi:uncharacterized membrane protein YfcA|nr:sulfite exporter TauE/SafE family protein [Phycisphaerae bacterium]